MASEALKIFTKKYAVLRNEGIKRASNITDWEYEWANLSWPDGYEPQPEDFQPFNRRDKILKLDDLFER